VRPDRGAGPVELAAVDVDADQVEVAVALVEAGDGPAEAAADVEDALAVADAGGVADAAAQPLGGRTVVGGTAVGPRRLGPEAPVHMPAKGQPRVWVVFLQAGKEHVEIGRRILAGHQALLCVRSLPFG
jgi:hypothetical protein